MKRKHIFFLNVYKAFTAKVKGRSVWIWRNWREGRYINVWESFNLKIVRKWQN